jgi:glycosyltransferase involved in cell wall biosynthesis
MKPINVFYDHQIFSLQRFGGISRYFVGLINEFQKMDSIRLEVGGIISDNHYLKEVESLKRISFPIWFKKGRKQASFILNSSYDNLRINKFDIYHPTYFYPYLLRKSSPYVVTVYDMIREKFPQDSSKKSFKVDVKKRLVKNASRIIAISENTKKDLIEIYSLPPERIDVIYLSTDLKGNFKKPTINNLPQNYILFIGERAGYKNFSRFIIAVGKIFSKFKDFYLVLGGGGNLSKSELEDIHDLGISNRVVQKNFSDQELISAYRNASCFVFPSLYEGFGIPILEAFQCHCPVVLSNSSSFPEVAGEASIYFDPYSIESMEESILKVIEDSSLRRQLINLGLERLKNFSQKRVALDTLKVYQKVIS